MLDYYVYQFLFGVDAAARVIIAGLGDIDVAYSDFMTNIGLPASLQFFFLCIFLACIAILLFAYIRGPLPWVVVILMVIMALYWVYPPIRTMTDVTTPAISQF